MTLVESSMVSVSEERQILSALIYYLENRLQKLDELIRRYDV